MRLNIAWAIGYTSTQRERVNDDLIVERASLTPINTSVSHWFFWIGGGCEMVPQLQAVVEDLASGREPSKVNARAFLGWYQAQRRGFYVVQRIRSELREARVITVPDFESAWIDGDLEFQLTSDQRSAITHVEAEPSVSNEAQSQDSKEPSPMAWIKRDATYRVRKLPTANTGVISVAPDDNLSEAVTLMLAGDYSQLPVMNGRDVKGILTWKSIGSRLGLNQRPETARQAMNHHVEVQIDSSLFDAIPMIIKFDYVLVRGDSNKVTGIVTASDLGSQFRTLTEPFLLLGEIENLMRNLIGDKFNKDELLAVQQSPPDLAFQDVSDFSLGDYVALLQNPERWERIRINIHRQTFCRKLDDVRHIRNKVMHFDTDGITPEHLTTLRAFTNLLKEIELITTST